jgi:meiotically up-regulated gene 157 (Mug157) protein
LADGIATHGLVEHPRHGQIWAYEVDGLGQHLLMDDANMPGLLSLPLVAGIAVDDPVYRRTRAFVLSDDNPYYYRGRVAAGVGSPHTPERYVWPIALAVEGLTSESPERALELLQLIASTTAGTGHVHEGFDVDDDTAYTRPWFSWADSMFCALALGLA